jgi:hypothetical protein
LGANNPEVDGFGLAISNLKGTLACRCGFLAHLFCSAASLGSPKTSYLTLSTIHERSQERHFILAHSLAQGKLSVVSQGTENGVGDNLIFQKTLRIIMGWGNNQSSVELGLFFFSNGIGFFVWSFKEKVQTNCPLFSA